jgi:hypothetical protein
MPNDQKPDHVRLPQQSYEVIGEKSKLNQPAAQKAKLDPRTVTQDPALKSKVASKKPNQ